MNILRKSLTGSLLLAALMITTIAQPMKREREDDRGLPVAKRPKVSEEVNEPKIIKLYGSDGTEDQALAIPKAAAMYSETIKNMIEDIGNEKVLAETSIPLNI